MEKEFIKNWLAKKSKIIAREFPEDFLDGVECNNLEMPGKNLLLGDQFFGYYQLCDITGELYFQEEELYKAKYIAYGSKQKSNSIKLPINHTDIHQTVKKYEKHLDDMIISIKSDLSKTQIKTKDDEIVRQIFNTLNLIRY